MRLLARRTLFFQEGASDKVYEVDLCEVGPGQHVVNYRYGRRGNPAGLREGTETDTPLPPERARQTFDKLVSSKLAKGYREVTGGLEAVPSAAPAPAPAAPPPVEAAAPAAPRLPPREESVLLRLQRGLLETAGDPPRRRTAAKPQPRPVVYDSRGRRVQAPPAPPPLQGPAWPLSRAVWRAGVLGLGAATPLLLQLLHLKAAPPTGTPEGDAARAQRELLVYSLIFALCRCAPRAVELTATQTAVPAGSADPYRTPAGSAALQGPGGALRAQARAALRGLADDAKAPDKLRRIAAVAVRQLIPRESRERVELDRPLRESLPPGLQEAERRGDGPALATALGLYLQAALGGSTAGDREPYRVLFTLTLLDSEAARHALLQALRDLPLQPGTFPVLRHLFKAAELRRDAELWGLLAYRFERAAPRFYRARSGKGARTPEGRRVSPGDLAVDARSPRAKLCFGEATRDYLRRRVWRTLRALGRLGDPDYVNLAVGVLVPFQDSDAVPIRQRVSSRYENRRYTQTTIYWDRFAPYLAFNHVLYGQSHRYQPQRNGRAFRCAPSYQPGQPAGARAAAREESFPALWGERPAGLMHLLAESRCSVVHEFAALALRAQTAFCATLDSDALLMLLASAYEVTARLGCDLAQARFSAAAPDLPVLAAMTDCAYARGAIDAMGLVEQVLAHAARDAALLARLCSGDFLVDLCASRHEVVRTTARRLITALILPAPQAQELSERLLRRLLRCGTGPASVTQDLTLEEARARDLGAVLLGACSAALRAVPVSVLLALIDNPLAGVQVIGARLCALREGGAAGLPEEVLLRLLRSLHPEVRGQALALIGQLPARALGEVLLRELWLHPAEDVRSAAAPLLRRALAAESALADRVGAALIAVLLTAPTAPSPDAPSEAEALHRSLVRLLRAELPGVLARLSLAQALALTEAPAAVAQELGGEVLRAHAARHGFADALDTPDIVRLGSHAVLSVRQACWALLDQVLPRLQASELELAAATRLLDAAWEDSRSHAARLFRERFAPEHWTPTLLVAICDSVRPEVQRLGRELISRAFREEDGPRYLVQLAEHPSAELQLFATNYLERYASDDSQRLQTLTPYFLAVLCRVNVGAVARRRVLAFLQAQALRSEAAARIVIEILGRTSATIAIGHRAAAIEALVRIRRAYPALRPSEGNIKVREAPLRGARGSHGV